MLIVKPTIIIKKNGREPFLHFYDTCIIICLFILKRFFSVPKAEKRAIALKENGKKLKEFALHHFNEIKKMNPSASLEDDFPSECISSALRNINIVTRLFSNRFTGH